MFVYLVCCAAYYSYFWGDVKGFLLKNLLFYKNFIILYDF